MKKVLLPTDFSAIANNAFVHALGLANTIDAELILLHNFELPIITSEYYSDNYLTIYESIELYNLDKFKEEITHLRALATDYHFEHIKMTHRLTNGDLMTSIKEVAENEQVDFLVMGTSGAMGWKELFVGTNTANAIVTINIPVLSVPVEAKFKKIAQIGFTTRYREKDKLALQKVIQIAKVAQAEIKCLYVKSEASDNSAAVFEAWRVAFRNEPIQFFIIPSEMIEQTILDFIEHQNIDLLAMLTYKRSFFKSLFTTRLTEKMSYSCPIPILAIHEN